jgi:hypothetical protein
MFGLLHNLYKFLKTKSERKLCLVVLGIDNAGKTTLLHTVQGELVSYLAAMQNLQSPCKPDADCYSLHNCRTRRSPQPLASAAPQLPQRVWD